jgi:uncharacterized protein (TIGR00730 family)
VTTPPARRSTGDDELDSLIDGLLDAAGANEHRRVLREIFVSAVGLARTVDDRLDLKIASAALYEMWDAFITFAPHKDLRKVTVFGSARTQPDSEEYQLAKQVASDIADRGWFVVTGAGPGIMVAANEGAGRERSFGVNIRLPFEQEANQYLVGDEKLVEMKYFFTRKLMLVKESSAFVALPGGFGTQDETYELLTLLQTGKAEPVPLVLLDIPGGTYWQTWDRFVREELGGGGLISPDDHTLYTVAESVEQACDAITGFWSNYHSLRYVGDRLVMRSHRPVNDETLAEINEVAHHLLDDGADFQRTGPLGPEIDEQDQLDLARISFRHGLGHYGNLRPLIDLINRH